uniref:jhy protein homolog n=1 Tax=Doryrhamphus excisus TaxID=161450 RepID=UPI0025AE744C|nr:jhy protein homolog [Doryrhamphus excisus]
MTKISQVFKVRQSIETEGRRERLTKCRSENWSYVDSYDSNNYCSIYKSRSRFDRSPEGTLTFNPNMDNKLRLAEKSPCQRPAVFTSQWDSLESNTENLAQESKQDLQMHIGEYILSDIFKEEDWGDAVADDTTENDLVEVAAQSHTRMEPGIDTHRSHLKVNDSNSQLCCDPNWRMNKKGEAVLFESLKTSTQEHHHFPRQKSSPFLRGYKYITDTSSVAVMTPHIAANHCQPYHLHSQYDPVSAIKTQHYNKALCMSSSDISTKADGDNTSNNQFKDAIQNGCDADDITEHSIDLKVYHTDNQQEVGRGFFPISVTTESPKTLRKKKQRKQTGDLIQRNKITLGRSVSGHGSYVSMHALKQKTSHAVKELHETAEDPELRLIQKTHQLKVTHFTEGSKTQGNMEPCYRSMEKSPECAASSKCQFCVTDNEQRWCQEDLFVKQSLENIPTTPSSTSHSTGADTKLPPIKSKLCPGHIAKTTDTIHSHSFDGYLAEMGHQTRTKPNYKAYSLNEYKQLKLDVTLQGLGPDYTAVKKIADKMKQQKLYSNGVRERNKNISKIPFIMAKDPVGKDKKVPRIKALEYAKTIAKPRLQPQPKSGHKQQSAGSTGHAPCLGGWDISQMTTVDLLMKRHQEEKDAIFRKVNVT